MAVLGWSWQETGLLLGAQRSVLESHLMAVPFSASCCIYIVLGATSEAYFEVEPAMLGNLSLECIGDWHLPTLATIMTGPLAFNIIP